MVVFISSQPVNRPPGSMSPLDYILISPRNIHSFYPEISISLGGGSVFLVQELRPCRCPPFLQEDLEVTS